MIGFPTCEQVTALLTELDEGALGLWSRAGVNLHLSMCPPCRAFLASLRQMPFLLRSLLEEPAPAAGEKALQGALAALRQGRLPQGPDHHPEPTAWATLQSGGDPLASLLLRVHLGRCGACRAAHGSEAALEPGGPGPLPDSLRALLPPEDRWRWTRMGLGGGQFATLLEDAASGATLYLATLPAGLAWPAHRHLGTETALMLSGGLQDGPAHLHPGDWITHGTGSQHAPQADASGPCCALVRIEGGLQFQGWRRWVVRA